MAKTLPVADGWFTMADPDEHGVRRVRETHVQEYGGGSMWLVEGGERCWSRPVSVWRPSGRLWTP